MSPDKMTPKEISKLAEDVRTIERFQNESINDGFDPSLFSATVVPKNKIQSLDWPLISFCAFIIIFIGLVIARFIVEVTPELEELLLVLSLVVGTLTVLTSHLRFKDKVISIILSIGLVVVVVIGFGVLTPKEAIDEAKEWVN